MIKIFVAIFLFWILSAVFVEPAFAYLDPGIGSVFFQALLATVAAVSISIGVFRNRLKSFWNRLLGRTDKTK